MDASRIRCLLTAGPTREYLDPVRYLTNPSTGKMGFALARAAAAAGCAVEMVAGPVALPDPEGVETVHVVTGEQMFTAVADRFPTCDLFIATAAVMDYRPLTCEATKIKKSDARVTLELAPVIDILKTMGHQRTRQLVVGFAAETDRVEEHARAKLERKNCHYIVANRVDREGAGFGADDNTVIVLGADGSREELGPMPKTTLADALIARFLAARAHPPQLATT